MPSSSSSISSSSTITFALPFPSLCEWSDVEFRSWMTTSFRSLWIHLPLEELDLYIRLNRISLLQERTMSTHFDWYQYMLRPHPRTHRPLISAKDPPSIFCFG
jgi:hypothetical protein